MRYHPGVSLGDGHELKFLTATMNKIRTLLFAAFAAAITGCSVDRIPGVYRIDIAQGNVITHEAAVQLQPGMTRQQVQFIMGTPTLVDTFHPDRWDYLYRVQWGNGDLENEHITVHFDGDTVSRITGDLPPKSAENGNEIQTISVTGQAPDSRGLLDKVWDSLTDWGDDN